MRLRVPWTIVATVILAAPLLAGCGESATPATPADAGDGRGSATAAAVGGPAREVIALERNTQATLGDLRIGAGNFWEEEYQPDGGAPRRGLTVGLWLYLRGDSSKDTHLRVYPGQTIDVAGYRLHVTEIQRTFVRLAVIRPGQP